MLWHIRFPKSESHWQWKGIQEQKNGNILQQKWDQVKVWLSVYSNNTRSHGESKQVIERRQALIVSTMVAAYVWNIASHHVIKQSPYEAIIVTYQEMEVEAPVTSNDTDESTQSISDERTKKGKFISKNQEDYNNRMIKHSRVPEANLSKLMIWSL